MNLKKKQEKNINKNIYAVPMHCKFLILHNEQ